MVDLKQKHHKGTIRQAKFILAENGSRWVEGIIRGNSAFNDGEYIHTSDVVGVHGNEIETRNSLYTVEWHPTHPVNIW